jgi:hypothetical protein
MPADARRGRVRPDPGIAAGLILRADVVVE